MPSLDLVQPVTESVQEILVRGDDGAVEIEFDHRLRLVNRLELAFAIGAAEFALGDIGGELDHLEWLAATIQKRIIGRLDPDRPPALGDALELPSLIFTASQSVPEFAIFMAVAALLVDKHAVMLAADFGKRVSHRVEKVRVRGDDRSVEIELNHRLGPVQRVELRLRVAGCRQKAHVIPPRCPATTISRQLLSIIYCNY